MPFFFARITFSFELSTPKLTFPPSFVNFPSGGPFPLSPPGLEGAKHFEKNLSDIFKKNCNLVKEEGKEEKP